MPVPAENAFYSLPAPSGSGNHLTYNYYEDGAVTSKPVDENLPAILSAVYLSPADGLLYVCGEQDNIIRIYTRSGCAASITHTHIRDVDLNALLDNNPSSYSLKMKSMLADANRNIYLAYVIYKSDEEGWKFNFILKKLSFADDIYTGRPGWSIFSEEGDSVWDHLFYSQSGINLVWGPEGWIICVSPVSDTVLFWNPQGYEYSVLSEYPGKSRYFVASAYSEASSTLCLLSLDRNWSYEAGFPKTGNIHVYKFK